MRWRLQTGFSAPGREVNEDHWFAVANAVGVLDGAGLGKAPRFAPEFATDAAWLVHACVDWFQRVAHDALSTTALLERLQTDITQAFGRADPDEPSGGPSACLTLARLVEVTAAKAVIDMSWIGDCVALLPEPDGGVRVIVDERVLPFEAKTFAAMAGLPRIDGQLGPAARAQITANRAHVNMPGGYAVVSPSRPWAHLAERASIAMDATRPLVLVSDGLSRLFDTFGSVTPADFHATCARGEAADLYARLRAIETADPNAERYTRFKIQDDATVVVAYAEPE